MAIYDLHPNPHGAGFLLTIQSNLLDELNTRLVVPLLCEDGTPRPFPRLNPLFEVDGERYVMATNIMASVLASTLKNPVANLSGHATEITDAVDFLLHGY